MDASAGSGTVCKQPARETAGDCHMSTVRVLKGKKLCEAFTKLYQPDSSKDVKS